MFQSLTERFSEAFKHLRGLSHLSEKNIQPMVAEIRVALLDADVGLEIVDHFLAEVTRRAIGMKVVATLTPGQMFLKTVQQALIELMRGEDQRLNLATQPPAVVMLAGLQGAGKTTSCVKLAQYLKRDLKKRPLVASVDLSRPAAVEQLHQLATAAHIDAFESDAQQTPVARAQAALAYAKSRYYDVLLIDTAGRLHIDQGLLEELKQLYATVHPIETLFVLDAMMGQDAVRVAKTFAETVKLTGLILSKADGDARGGAALSGRHITGRPIKFLGTGETVDDFEPFVADRIASRILGMGDVLSLIEKLEKELQQPKLKAVNEKLVRGGQFTLEDFQAQLKQFQSMGGASLLKKHLPAHLVSQGGLAESSDRFVAQADALINSMTRAERKEPAIIKASRKRRIAAGAGRSVPELNQLLKRYEEMESMMRRFKKGNLLRNLSSMIKPGFRG